jgi:hypothetical protein
MARGRAKSAKTTHGWDRSAPKTKGERRALKKRCGRRAFLEPGLMKFPVVAKGSRACLPDCRALRVAKQRASAHGYVAARRKAQDIAERVGCRWAR